MSGVIQLCDSRENTCNSSKHKALTCSRLRVGGCSSVQLVCASVPVASARLYRSALWNAELSARDASRRKQNGARGHAPSNQTTHNTAAGTPCVMMGYPIKTQTTQHDELMCLSFCHDASGKLSFSTNQTSVRCLEDVLEVSKDVSSVHQVSGYLVQSKQ